MSLSISIIDVCFLVFIGLLSFASLGLVYREGKKTKLFIRSRLGFCFLAAFLIIFISVKFVSVFLARTDQARASATVAKMEMIRTALNRLVVDEKRKEISTVADMFSLIRKVDLTRDLDLNIKDGWGREIESRLIEGNMTMKILSRGSNGLEDDSSNGDDIILTILITKKGLLVENWEGYVHEEHKNSSEGKSLK